MVPKRKANEDRNEYISRCISSLHDIDKDKSDEQIQAICINEADMSAFMGLDEYKEMMNRRYPTK